MRPALMQEVHTLSRLGVPDTMARTFWMFGFQRRRVRRCECDTLLPKPGPLPQMSQTEATVRSIGRLVESVGARARGDTTPAGTRQLAEHTRRHARRANRAATVEHRNVVRRFYAASCDYAPRSPGPAAWPEDQRRPGERL